MCIRDRYRIGALPNIFDSHYKALKEQIKCRPKFRRDICRKGVKSGFERNVVHFFQTFLLISCFFGHFIRRNIKPVYLKCCTQVSSVLFTLICGARFFINILCTQPKRFQQFRSRSGISEFIIHTDFYHTNRIGFANSF